MSEFRTLISSGRLADPFDLKHWDVTPEILAHGLANINRYSGNCLVPYSVAQHSVALSQIVPPQYQKAALLHDAPEIFIGDAPSPLKKRLGAVYDAIEDEIMERIFDLYDVDVADWEKIKHLDRQICVNEMRDFFPESGLTFEDAIPDVNFVALTWQQARDAYRAVFRRVFHV